MSMFEVGTRVVDRRERCEGRIAHVERVPWSVDLFGHFVPSHHRYTVAYEQADGVNTGEWHNTRMETDLAPIDFGE